MARRERTPIVEPTWEIATLFPDQGHWSEEEYLALPTNHFVEFSDGHIEMLPMPSIPHQRIFALLFRILFAYVDLHPQGEVFAAPLPMRLRSGRFREPDIAFMLDKHDARIHRQYLSGADLVMEIVSPDNPARDYEQKRAEYAEAGITEYWIIDPQQEIVIVLTLSGETYATHGVFRRGDTATSARLDGFSVDVTELLAVGEWR